MNSYEIVTKAYPSIDFNNQEVADDFEEVLHTYVTAGNVIALLNTIFEQQNNEYNAYINIFKSREAYTDEYDAAAECRKYYETRRDALHSSFKFFTREFIKRVKNGNWKEITK